MFSLRRSLLATLFPYTTLFRSGVVDTVADHGHGPALVLEAADHVDLVLGHDPGDDALDADLGGHALGDRSEEHTSELQSRGHLVCRLLLAKTKNKHEQ